MQIVGFNFDSLSASRLVKKIEKVNVKHNVNLVSINKDEVDLGRKQPVLKVNFEFTVKYDPDIGNIKIAGSLLVTDQQKELDKIFDNWEKEKKLTQEQTTMLINSVLVKSNIKALNLSQDVNLPPHIPLPKITPKVDTENYIG
jgi:hypothetical protein